MNLLYALNEIGEWCIANPWRAVLSFSCVEGVIIALWFGGVHPLISGPPTIACWLLGLHIRLQDDK